MNNNTRFDVLVVYNGALAASASGASNDNTKPFQEGSRNESYNNVYGYFLEICRKFNLKAAFTTSTDIIGAGYCKSFWQYKRKRWIKRNSSCYSRLIFDKFSPTRESIKKQRNLMFSLVKIKSFNDPYVYKLFFDKQKTYNEFSDHSIPTVSLIGDIKDACKTLEKIVSNHPDRKDFSSDIVMKDRFGAGGRNIFKFKHNQLKDMLAILHRNTNISYVIQPFVKFDKGFVYNNHSASTDIRLIYLNGKIVQSYIRTAKSGEFLCNEHQGGLLTYLSLQEIPSKLVEMSELIAKELSKNQSLFALDFIISNSGRVYLLEGNSQPGLDWNTSLKTNEIEAKKLINLIIAVIVNKTKVQLKTQNLSHPISHTSSYIN